MSTRDDILSAPVVIRKGKHARWFLGYVSDSQQDIWIADGTLPPPVQFSERIYGWTYQTLVEHFREFERGAKRRSAA